MAERSTTLLGRRTLVGLIPAAVIYMALVLADQTVDYRFVGKGRDLAGLEDNTIYLRSTTQDLCANQAVYAKQGERRYLVPIGAVAGQTVTADAEAIRGGDTVIDLGAEWERVARSEIAEASIDVIPDGHVMIINTGFEADHEIRGWGVAVIPEADVGASLTHVLFSRNVTRIGQPAKSLGACMTRTTDGARVVRQIGSAPTP